MVVAGLYAYSVVITSKNLGAGLLGSPQRELLLILLLYGR